MSFQLGNKMFVYFRFLLSILILVIILSSCQNNTKKYADIFNNCIKEVCNGDQCCKCKADPNISVKNLFGEFDQKIEQNKWICNYIPLQLYPVPGESEEVFVTDIIEYKDNLKCEFVVTFSGFLFKDCFISLYCSSDEKPEFLGTGIVPLK